MDSPQLYSIDVTPSKEALVIIRGLASQEKVGLWDHRLWIEPIRRMGFTGSIYHYWWDSTGTALNYSKAKSRAKKVGQYHFGDDLSTLQEPQISIIAHSMGCRIPYHFVQNVNLDTQNPVFHLPGNSLFGQLQKNLTRQNPLQDRLKNFILVGGHIKRDTGRPWHLFPQFFSGTIHNLYNPDDSKLALWHKTFGRFDKSSCGRKPIKYKHPRLKNHRVTDIGSSHSKYYQVLDKYIRW